MRKLFRLACGDRLAVGHSDANRGFSTFAGFGAVDPQIVWAKLASLAEGAAIASDALWARAA